MSLRYFPLSCSGCMVSSSLSCWPGRFASSTRNTKMWANIRAWVYRGDCAKSGLTFHPLSHVVPLGAPQPFGSTRTCQPERRRRPWASWPFGRAWYSWGKEKSLRSLPTHAWDECSDVRGDIQGQTTDGAHAPGLSPPWESSAALTSVDPLTALYMYTLLVARALARALFLPICR